MGVARPLTTGQTVNAQQNMARVIARYGVARPLTPQGGAEEGQQRIGRVISGGGQSA